MSLKAIAINALRPDYFRVMCGKVVRRITEFSRRQQAEDVTAWCERSAESYEDYAVREDAELWAESIAFSEDCASYAEKKLSELDVDLGGGAIYPLLYFIVRIRKPETAVETGVAAGFSSYAILAALEKNAKGRLLSSDFPYFRLKQPEQYVGYVVPQELRARWELFTKGDQYNLREISKRVEKIELFHYDSDKSYAGREFALTMLGPLFDDRSIVLVDDIQDNFFFRDYVEAKGCDYRVFGFGGKYIGAIGI